MRKYIKKTISLVIMILLISCSFAGCDASSKKDGDDVEIVIFAAKSLNNVLNNIIEVYTQSHDGISIVANYDSSGTLMAQIEEGATCNIFFPADMKQMDELKQKGLLIDGSIKNIVNNQLCIITYKGSNTKVTCLNDMYMATSLAIADGSVPAGKYTRQALVKCGILPEAENVGKIKTSEISAALNSVEINECSNVGVVASSVASGANEVGTVYYSDTFSYEDKLEIIEILPYDLTGNIIYPAALVENENAKESTVNAARDFLDYLTSDAAQEIFELYHFDGNVK